MHAVFTFNRFDLPTTEHQMLVDKVNNTASSVGGKPHVFLTHSQDAIVPYTHKVVNARAAFGSIVHHTPHKHIIDVMKHLHKQGYKDTTLVTSKDTVEAYKNTLNKHNGKDYNFDSINVVSSGHRDPEGNYKKMRAAAQENNSAKFKAGLSAGVQKHAARIMGTVRRNMKEGYEEGTDKARRAFIAATPGQVDIKKRVKKLQQFRAFYKEDKKTLNKPVRNTGGRKKFSVYVRNDKGNTVKVGFGDPNLSIKRDNPARRKSFRARHNCDNPGPKTKT